MYYNMNKKLIRLTESDLHRIVKESVQKILNEGFFDKFYQGNIPQDDTQSNSQFINGQVPEKYIYNTIRQACYDASPYNIDNIKDVIMNIAPKVLSTKCRSEEAKAAYEQLQQDLKQYGEYLNCGNIRIEEKVYTGIGYKIMDILSGHANAKMRDDDIQREIKFFTVTKR